MQGAGKAEAQTPCNYVETNGNNCYFHTQTAVAAGTYVPGSPFPTATPGTPTPYEAPNLLASPTAFTQSSICPTGVWDAMGLDFGWAQACSHCIPAGATNTPGGFAVMPTFPLETWVFSTFSPPTLAPSATPTLTLTPSPTPTGTLTPTWTPVPSTVKYSYFPTDGQDGWVLNQSPDWWYGASHLQGFWNGAGWQSAKNPSDNGHNVAIRVDLGGQFYVTRIYGVSSPAVSGGNWLMIGRNSTGGSNLFQQQAGDVHPNMSLRYIGVQLTSSGSLGGAAIQSVLIEGYPVSAGTPTPTLTPTLTPTITPTLPPSQTPDRAFGLLANCQVPVYRPVGQPVEMSIEPEGAPTCYRLFPQIDIDWDAIVSVDVHTRAIDLCFIFYSPELSVMGIDFNLEFLVGVFLVLFLVIWGLFSL